MLLDASGCCKRKKQLWYSFCGAVIFVWHNYVFYLEAIPREILAPSTGYLFWLLGSNNPRPRRCSVYFDERQKVVKFEATRLQFFEILREPEERHLNGEYIKNQEKSTSERFLRYWNFCARKKIILSITFILLNRLVLHAASCFLLLYSRIGVHGYYFAVYLHGT